MFDGKNSFVKNDIRTYKSIKKIDSGQGDDYTTNCLLDYPYFKENYKLIATDLIKQQACDADPKVMQQINITGNLDQAGNTTLFILEEIKKSILHFSHGIVRVL